MTHFTKPVRCPYCETLLRDIDVETRVAKGHRGYDYGGGDIWAEAEVEIACHGCHRTIFKRTFS